MHNVVTLDGRPDRPGNHLRTIGSPSTTTRSPRLPADALSLDWGSGADIEVRTRSQPRTPLTWRQREVASLVAQGLTNRQIAAELVIAEGTVALHVKHILRKLGFVCRAQVAAWVVAEELTHTSPLRRSEMRRPPMRPVGHGGQWPRTETAAAHARRLSTDASGERPHGGTRADALEGGARDSDWPRREPVTGWTAAAEVTDAEWTLVAPLLPPPAARGRGRADDRRTLNGILWVLGTGAHWGDVPRRFGAASTCHRRFQDWRQRGVWEPLWQLLKQLRSGSSSNASGSTRRQRLLEARRAQRARHRGKPIRWYPRAD